MTMLGVEVFRQLFLLLDMLGGLVAKLTPGTFLFNVSLDESGGPHVTHDGEFKCLNQNIKLEYVKDGLTTHGLNKLNKLNLKLKT